MPSKINRGEPIIFDICCSSIDDSNSYAFSSADEITIIMGGELDVAVNEIIYPATSIYVQIPEVTGNMVITANSTGSASIVATDL